LTSVSSVLVIVASSKGSDVVVLETVSGFSVQRREHRLSVFIPETSDVGLRRRSEESRFGLVSLLSLVLFRGRLDRDSDDTVEERFFDRFPVSSVEDSCRSASSEKPDESRERFLGEPKAIESEGSSLRWTGRIVDSERDFDERSPGLGMVRESVRDKSEIFAIGKRLRSKLGIPFVIGSVD
jgi:hypothetical protein